MKFVTDLPMKFSLPDDLTLLVGDNFPKRRSHLRVRVVEGETLVLDRQESQIHQLNQTASYIWDRCDGKSTVAEIAKQLAEVFDIDSMTAPKDVATIIRQLQRLNLLESC